MAKQLSGVTKSESKIPKLELNAKRDVDKENAFIYGKVTKHEILRSTKKKMEIIQKKEENKFEMKDLNINKVKSLQKRIPLQDIRVPTKNGPKYLEVRSCKQLFNKLENENKQLNTDDDSDSAFKVNFSGECSNHISISRDSLPLSFKRLNIKPSNELERLPDYKYVTTERDFDPLGMDDSLMDNISISNNDESILFDDSFSDEDIINKELFLLQSKNKLDSIVFKVPDTQYIEGTSIKTHSDKSTFIKSHHNESTSIIQHHNEVTSLDVQQVEGTPSNAHPLPEFKGIKQVRKNAIAQNVGEDKVVVNAALLETFHNTMKENNVPCNSFISKFRHKHLLSMERKDSLRSVPSPVIYVDPKKHGLTKYCTNFDKMPGAVCLDSQENFVFQQIIYSTTYLDFIIKHLLQKELKFQLSTDFLKKYFITDSNRSIVINWLIKLQTYMRADHVLVYTAVRLMDCTIDSCKIPLNMLQLVALASFWISLKYHDKTQKEVKWMVKQSGGAYTVEELSEMERTVFRANKFDVEAVDLSTFIHYYILNLGISNADVVAHCSHYLLDCSLLTSRFVRTLPSMMAAAAVFTSLHLLKQYNNTLWMKLCLHCGYYTPDVLKAVKRGLIEVIKQVNNPSFPCREPYYKYCSSRYCGVARIVLDALENDFN